MLIFIETVLQWNPMNYAFEKNRVSADFLFHLRASLRIVWSGKYVNVWTSNTIETVKQLVHNILRRSAFKDVVHI